MSSAGGWLRGADVDEAAEAAEVSVRCARKWVAGIAWKASGLDGSFFGASLDPAPHERATGAGNRGAQAAAVHRR